MKLKPEDYKGKPVSGRQGRDFEEFDRQGYDVIEVLQFLRGQPWDELSLGYVHALRPSRLRVVGPNEGTQMDAQSWRVTVYLNPDNTIREIEQEVVVGLPPGIDHGHHLSFTVRARAWCQCHDHPIRHVLHRHPQDRPRAHRRRGTGDQVPAPARVGNGQRPVP